MIKHFFVVYQSSHQPTWWSDTLAICDVEAISESLLKITNKNKVEDMCKLIEVDCTHGDRPRVTMPSSVACLQETYYLCSQKTIKE